MKKTCSLNIRFSPETAAKARTLIMEAKYQHGIETTMSGYMRTIIENVINTRHAAAINSGQKPKKSGQ